MTELTPLDTLDRARKGGDRINLITFSEEFHSFSAQASVDSCAVCRIIRMNRHRSSVWIRVENCEKLEGELSAQQC